MCNYQTFGSGLQRSSHNDFNFEINISDKAEVGRSAPRELDVLLGADGGEAGGGSRRGGSARRRGTGETKTGGRGGTEHRQTDGNQAEGGGGGEARGRTDGRTDGRGAVGVFVLVVYSQTDGSDVNTFRCPRFLSPGKLDLRGR